MRRATGRRPHVVQRVEGGHRSAGEGEQADHVTLHGLLAEVVEQSSSPPVIPLWYSGDTHKCACCCSMRFCQPTERASSSAKVPSLTGKLASLGWVKSTCTPVPGCELAELGSQDVATRILAADRGNHHQVHRARTLAFLPRRSPGRCGGYSPDNAPTLGWRSKFQRLARAAWARDRAAASARRDMASRPLSAVASARSSASKPDWIAGSDERFTFDPVRGDRSAPGRRPGRGGRAAFANRAASAGIAAASAALARVSSRRASRRQPSHGSRAEQRRELVDGLLRRLAAVHRRRRERQVRLGGSIDRDRAFGRDGHGLAHEETRLFGVAALAPQLRQGCSDPYRDGRVPPLVGPGQQRGRQLERSVVIAGFHVGLDEPATATIREGGEAVLPGEVEGGPQTPPRASLGLPSHNHSTPLTSNARASVNASPTSRASVAAPSTASKATVSRPATPAANARDTATAARRAVDGPVVELVGGRQFLGPHQVMGAARRVAPEREVPTDALLGEASSAMSPCERYSSTAAFMSYATGLVAEHEAGEPEMLEEPCRVDVDDRGGVALADGQSTTGPLGAAGDAVRRLRVLDGARRYGTASAGSSESS